MARVVADRRSPRDGRFIETIGRYNAQTDPSTIVLERSACATGSRAARSRRTVRSSSRRRASPSAVVLVRELLEYLARRSSTSPSGARSRSSTRTTARSCSSSRWTRMTTDRSSDAAGAPPRRSAPSSRPPRSRTTGASSSTSSSELDGRPRRPAARARRLVPRDRSSDCLPAAAVVCVAGVAAHDRAPRRHGGAADPAPRRLHAPRGRGGAARRGAVVARAAPLEEGEFWARELEGCARGRRRAARSASCARMVALPSLRGARGRPADGSSCSCRWCATRSARWTSRRGGSTSTWGSWVDADVFTLFPQWFEWFRGAAARRQRAGAGAHRRSRGPARRRRR